MEYVSQKILILCLYTAIRAYCDSMGQVVDVADILLKAEQEGRPIPVLSLQYPSIDVIMAYQAQRSYVQKRLKVEKIAGFYTLMKVTIRKCNLYFLHLKTTTIY